MQAQGMPNLLTPCSHCWSGFWCRWGWSEQVYWHWQRCSQAGSGDRGDSSYVLKCTQLLLLQFQVFGQLEFDAAQMKGCLANWRNVSLKLGWRRSWHKHNLLRYSYYMWSNHSHFSSAILLYCLCCSKLMRSQVSSMSMKVARRYPTLRSWAKCQRSWGYNCHRSLLPRRRLRLESTWLKEA